MPGQASAQPWSYTTNLVENWTSLAMSSDGGKIAASSFISGVFTSTDGGTTWTNVGSPDPIHWSALVSADGGNLVAAFYEGGIYTSTNWGVDWLPSSAPTNAWNCLAASADGTRLVAGASPGFLFCSTNSGATWQCPFVTYSNLTTWTNITTTTTNKTTWTNTTIYTNITVSTNFSSPYDFWQSVASSASGDLLLAASSGTNSLVSPTFGEIYASTNGGVTWAPQNTVLATNLITTDTFSVSVITTNLNTHHTISTNTTNFRTTVASTNAPGTNVVTLGTAIGIDVAGTTVTNTNTVAIAKLLGVSLQGAAVFGVSPLNTDQLGTNTLDHGLHVSNFAATNTASATLTIPDIAGAAFTNAFDAADLDLPSSFTNLVPGMEVVITNVLHVEAAVSHVPQGWSAVAASANGSRLVGRQWRLDLPLLGLGRSLDGDPRAQHQLVRGRDLRRRHSLGGICQRRTPQHIVGPRRHLEHDRHPGILSLVRGRLVVGRRHDGGADVPGPHLHRSGSGHPVIEDLSRQRRGSARVARQFNLVRPANKLQLGNRGLGRRLHRY